MQRLLLHLYGLGKLEWKKLPLWYRWLWCASKYFFLKLDRAGKCIWLSTPLFGVHVAWGAKSHNRQGVWSGVRFWAIPKHWTLLYDEGDHFYRHSWETVRFTPEVDGLTSPQ